ncbi:MAG: chromate transporter [Rikenellaceae bacterium]
MEQQIRLRDLFTTFLKIGVFTFGGGFAMISLIEREIIERRTWLPKKEFADLLTLAQAAPGPLALNSAVFIGYKSRGYKGAFAALAGVVLPSFTILLIVALYFSHVRDNKIVDAAFKGMRPTVIALIMVPVISLLRPMRVLHILFALIVAVVLWYFAFSPIYLLVASAAVGVVWAYLTTKRSAR